MYKDDSEIAGLWCWALLITIFYLIFISGGTVAGTSLETDQEVLLELKSFLKNENKVNQGSYVEWGEQSLSPCDWVGITCTGSRVSGINLSGWNISGKLFSNFSALTQLSHLDLSDNAIDNQIPSDLNGCTNLRYLNLSHNILDGYLNLTGLKNLETLDVTVNRLSGGIKLNFPAICDKLIVLNISANNFTGDIDNCFDECQNLMSLDLSSNNFNGQLWPDFARLREFSVSQNYLTGPVSPDTFAGKCSLKMLDLSENRLTGEFPKEISRCDELVLLNIWGNKFNGSIRPELGLLSNLNGLFLGNNSFDKEIPESLLNCTKLSFLDLSKNRWGGEIQGILGRFKQVKYLALHGNSYIGGINSSGILKLPNIVRLDLSLNNFSGPLPIEISMMPNLKLLILSKNRFSGSIPLEYGNIASIQAIDLSFNSLTGSIPKTFGNLKSLLWLMLANNYLTGEIPSEIGNCNSLLWLNLANNRLSGKIPLEISSIGKNPYPTFEANRKDERLQVASGECTIMKRWLPADYPPFSFVYILLTRKSCRNIWDRLLRGYGLFPICRNSSAFATLEISGYLQLTGNQLSGELPPEIGEMQNFSLLHIGINELSGNFPPEIERLPLAVLNASHNRFSGGIPPEIGNIRCLQNIDLSYNNFSGEIPASLDGLANLNKFNISYNPLLSGQIPKNGQLSTFDNDSFIGNPLLVLQTANWKNSSGSTTVHKFPGEKQGGMAAFLVFLVLTLAFLVCGMLSSIVCIVVRKPSKPALRFPLEVSKYQCNVASTYGASSSGASSSGASDAVKIIRLDKKTAFTYVDILTATENFSESMVIGKGGFGTVYRGILPEGQIVAVKKLQREGTEGEREFRAEMEALTVGGPHTNLVSLFGWCLYGPQKLLVYEYMEGGSLEDLVSDNNRLGWRTRIEVALGVANALAFLHHQCYPPVVHRDVKASNVLLDKEGRAKVTDFGLARIVGPGESHVSTIVAGTVGYVAPEYGQTWRATTKGDVYSFGILTIELATGKRAVDGGEECLLDWVKRVADEGWQGLRGVVVPVMISGIVVVNEGEVEGLEEMCELLRIGLRCAAEAPQARPDMKEVLAMLVRISGNCSF